MTGSGSREALPGHRWDSGLQRQLESWRPVRPPHRSRLCGDRRWPWCGEKEGWPRLPGGDCWRARAGARGLWLTPQGAVAHPQHCARQDGPPPLAVTLSGADTLFSQAQSWAARSAATGMAHCGSKGFPIHHLIQPHQNLVRWVARESPC